MATQLPPIVRDSSSPSKYAGSRVNTSQSQRLKVTLSRKSNKSRPQHRQHGFKREVKVPTTLNYDIEGGDVLEPPSDVNPRHRACLELLVNGHIEAFSELFTLTQNNDALANDEASLVALQQDLAIAEHSHRSHDIATEYEARRRLAEQFEASGDVNTALHFRKSCLDSSPTADKAQLVESYNSLGKTLERHNNMEEALSCFESAATIVEEQNLSGTALEDTYEGLVRQLVNQAQKLIEAGNVEQAQELLTRALGKATLAESTPLQSMCYLMLGQCCQELGDNETAIQHLDKFMDGNDGTADQQCQACALLARCHEQRGDADTATQYYTELVKNCKKTEQWALVADTCAQLGRLALAQDNTAESVRWYTEAHSVAQQTGLESTASEIAVKLALARSRSLGDQFRGCIAGNSISDLLKLLSWKSSRSENAFAAVTPGSPQIIEPSTEDVVEPEAIGPEAEEGTDEPSDHTLAGDNGPEDASAEASQATDAQEVVEAAAEPSETPAEHPEQ